MARFENDLKQLGATIAYIFEHARITVIDAKPVETVLAARLRVCACAMAFGRERVADFNRQSNGYPTERGTAYKSLHRYCGFRVARSAIDPAKR